MLWVVDSQVSRTLLTRLTKLGTVVRDSLRKELLPTSFSHAFIGVLYSMTRAGGLSVTLGHVNLRNEGSMSD